MLETVHVDSHGASRVGRQREVNQDQYLIADLTKTMWVRQTSLRVEDRTRLTGEVRGKLLAVADGMGGQAAGDFASASAMHTITTYVINTMPWFFGQNGQQVDLERELATALKACRKRLLAESRSEPQLARMGTTMTMAYIVWPRAFVVHAGDSRCYLARDSHLQQITKDHSVAQQLIDQGTMPAEAAEQSRFAHVLHNAIVADPDSDLSPAVYPVALAEGDALLLCTDGLTKELPDEQIETVLNQADSAEDAAFELVRHADAAGGDDDATAVVARFHLLDART